MKYTKPTKESHIQRSWHLISTKEEVLGRMAGKISKLLIGKSKPYFVRNLDLGDYVVVTNAALVKVTGDKQNQKVYTSYSGYPGGLKEEKFKDLLQRRPEEIIRRAVSGMLPKNKLRKRMLRRLFIYRGEEHPYKDKLA